MKTTRKREAVAPVLATLLMIAVAVAMSVIIFMWSQGFLSQTSSATGGQQGAQNQAAQSSIAVELGTFVPCPSGTCTLGTSPVLTLVVRNVGAVTVKLGSMTITGSSSNSGFTGTITTSSISTTGTIGLTDAGCTTIPYTATTASMSKGGSSTIVVGPPAAACTGADKILSGDVVNVKITTNVGTFAAAQFTVP